LLRRRSVGTLKLSNIRQFPKAGFIATAFCMRVHATRARLDSLGTRNQRAYNMETHYPTFHGEYWVYALAGVVIITLGIFLYTV
jgi:hypothetical protein